MLIKVKTLKGYSLSSFDGEIGQTMEFYFDDQHWTIRYLVAETGDWLSDRKVLIAPYALVEVRKEEKQIVVNLTKKQIEDSPTLDSDRPVSRQFEEEYYGYYDWPTYWAGPYMWGSYSDIVRDSEKWTGALPGKETGDSHLRSTQEVSGYHVQGVDGEIGHVEDFILDDETWAIRYLVISTQNWWPGRKVLVSPLWIDRVSWNESKVFINLSCESIKQSPEYTDDSNITRDYETGLHRHYDRKGYWVDVSVISIHHAEE